MSPEQMSYLFVPSDLCIIWRWSKCRRSNCRRSICRRSKCGTCLYLQSFVLYGVGANVVAAIVVEQLSPEQMSYLFVPSVLCIIWRRSKCRRSICRRSKCRRSICRKLGANVVGANVAGANVAGANVAGAFVAGANVAGALVVGANVAGAFVAEQLSRSICRIFRSNCRRSICRRSKCHGTLRSKLPNTHIAWSPTIPRLLYYSPRPGSSSQRALDGARKSLINTPRDSCPGCRTHQ